MLLVLGLLGGSLVSLLLLNTILAQGSFRLADLQRETTRLEHREQALRRQVALAESPQVLARKARKLGMVPVPNPAFVDTDNGEIYGEAQPASTPSQPRSDRQSRGAQEGGQEGARGNEQTGDGPGGTGQDGASAGREGNGDTSGSNGQPEQSGRQQPEGD